jgi:hypothetical protein
MYSQLLGAGMERTIDLGQYIASLCEGFPDLQQDHKGKAKLICNTEPPLIGLDIAIVVGMAVAEAVTNSYKHAIHDDNGAINVRLRRSEATSDEAILTISDNGPECTWSHGRGSPPQGSSLRCRPRFDTGWCSACAGCGRGGYGHYGSRAVAVLLRRSSAEYPDRCASSMVANGCSLQRNTRAVSLCWISHTNGLGPTAPRRITTW